MASSGPPIATLYVQNLEERVKMEKMKEALSQIFSEYGNVIDIVAKTNLRAKGQAFIVFDDPASAESALEEVQGFELFDKPMRLALARSRSDATVKATGNPDDLEQHKRKRVAEKEKRMAAEAAEEQKGLKRANELRDMASRPAKLARGTGLKSSNPTAPAVVPDEYLPPNKTLFIQNIPDDLDADGLTAVFARFEGFKEVRLVPGRKGIAFVEYEAEPGAITAKENTAGMPLGESARKIKVTYQRQ